MARRRGAAAEAEQSEGEQASAPSRSKATPAAPKVLLTPYEGKDVLSTSVSITNAGDGLSKAMSVEPTELHHGQRVMVVLDCVVNKIRYDPIEETDGLQRVHILKAGTATFLDAKAARDALDKTQRKIEAASGILHLPGVTESSEGDGEGDDGEKSPEEWEAQYPQGPAPDDLDPVPVNPAPEAEGDPQDG